MFDDYFIGCWFYYSSAAADDDEVIRSRLTISAISLLTVSRVAALIYGFYEP